VSVEVVDRCEDGLVLVLENVIEGIVRVSWLASCHSVLVVSVGSIMDIDG